MPLRFPVAILFSVSLVSVGLLSLQGCARGAIREATLAQGEAPNAIRTLGADQRFSTLSSQNVAQRLRERYAGRPVNILALSGGAPMAPLGRAHWWDSHALHRGLSFPWSPA